MFKILVVEDDKDLNRSVCLFLNQNGYSATGCLSAREAYDAMYENIYDLILSDIMMPEIDGFDFAKTVRSLNEAIPNLFMSARDDFASKERGYRTGIDDYMVKPIDFEELLLRIGALLRRAKIASDKQITVGRFRMDADEHTAYLDGKEIPLTAREFDLLYKLLSCPDKTYTRRQLMDEIWDLGSDSDEHTVNVHINRLRDRLKENRDFAIVTVRGLGYKAVRL